MTKTWLLVGGLRDGETVKLSDQDIVKETFSCVEMKDLGGVALKYHVFVRGGITDRLSGG